MADNILFFNGKIFASSKSPLQQWMIVDSRSSTIQQIGSTQYSGEFVGRKIDLEGKLVLPGLHDAHIHVHNIGMLLECVNVSGVLSIEDLKIKLKDYISHNNSTDWVQGFGWDQEAFSEKRYPTKEDIDAVAPHIPVLISRACRHIAVLNSKALEILGITKETQSPKGGQIDKDEKGNPTGILRELALDTVMEKIYKSFSLETRKKYISKGLDICFRNGITAVQTNDETAWNIYKELQQANKLPIRVFLTPYQDEIGHPETPNPKQGDNYLSSHRVKILADGSLGAETAALRHAYKGTCNHGLLVYDQEKLNNMVKVAHKNGFRLEVHAIGDLAAQSVLDAFDAAGIRPADRPILTHCQILGLDLIQRMARMGVIANVQPQFVTTDSLWAEKRVGDLTYSYAWKTMLQEGVHVAGGSDAPIEHPNPFMGMHAAIFRHDRQGKTWMPEQCLTVPEAVMIYTEGAAYAAESEHKLGRLEPGFLADFVILNDDILQIPAKLANDPKTLLAEVWINGEKKI